MLKKAQAAIAIAVATGALAALPTSASAYRSGGYYMSGSGPYAGSPGPYSGYVVVPYGGYIGSNIAYSPGGYSGYGSHYGRGRYSGPFRTDSAPLTGGGY